MPPGFILRPARNADCSSVQSLVFGILAEYGLLADPGSTDADLFDLEAFYEGQGGAFSVVEDLEGNIVASVGLAPDGPDSCELRKMYVLPRCRGLGLGKELLRHALDQARQLGFQEIRLETASVLKEAVVMYERAGFQPYEPEHCAARCDAAYRMSLR